jgi:manganese transport protein
MWKLPRLPTTATAPFCPSEARGTIAVSALSEPVAAWKRLLQFAGPGLLVSVGYMDPGNWATDIEAGSRYGYSLLFVVMLSSLAAILLQCLSMRLGLVTGRDLAQHCRARYSRPAGLALWIFAELAIIATDVAEVLGSALAFKLLFGVSLPTGIAITALDTFIVLSLKGKGFRQVEAIILGLVATIGICYLVELWLIPPDWVGVFHGLIPDFRRLDGPEPWYLAVGILGATVMPHNLYLHSSIVQTRQVPPDAMSRRSALRFATVDTSLSLLLAFLVNAAILILSATAFHQTGRGTVTEIDNAYRLLEPVVGSAIASIAFGVALLASGQSATFTGTIAGQVIMEGFLDLKIPCWKRRLITRGLALLPAMAGVLILGEHSTGKLLVLTQVVLSLQLPFAIFPLLRLTFDRGVMGEFATGPIARVIAWFLFVAITSANGWMISTWIS